ncbi:MAG: hypothetical protein DMG65_11330 [Candidatus Angelobacter sp. Gp1-AA117]|nr:MAG: hypothetical protein DMG65_11330 [Candidatus Angelobacter sp. Gp1-AA117]
MSEENRKTFFENWLGEYSDRLQQVCQGVQEKMQTLYSDTTQIARSALQSSEPAVSSTRPLNL